ncbi:MAG: hypothetical protein FJ279_23720, partial [Planctomycetes bacterium]|nr:hypothetical protein [Planctomycetota bacterium]
MPLKKQDELFIQAAIKRGVLTKAQAEECAASQESMAAMGIEKNLAQIAQDKGFLDRQRAMSVMRAIQRKSVRAEIGGYEILGMLGKGGMGSVYKARQRSMNRVVALKVLPASLAMDAKCRARFLLEVKAVAKLNHPNIVQAIDTGEVDGMHFFVMEYVDGRSVDHMLKHEGIIDEQRAVRIALQIAKALQYAEPFAIVHR